MVTLGERLDTALLLGYLIGFSAVVAITEVHGIFKVFDKDPTGFLSTTELRHIGKKLPIEYDE
ncbi:Parvalbumin [Parasponia andersonii]|uniref:Parvalbumin n=1 Tax=Parasponia andersonii TaxID=3476 RepID=A0A2P5E177_PARAD|nr:Parvalbumin [Parasponia andersonii]